MVVVILVPLHPIALPLLLLLLHLQQLEFQDYLKRAIGLGMMGMMITTLLLYKQIQAIRHLKVGFSMAGIMIIILTAKNVINI